MITKDYIISSPEGIHARPAAALVRLARPFRSSIQLKKGGRTVALNSLLNLMGLGIKEGDTVTLVVEGEDELEAALAIGIFFTEQLK